MTGRFRPVDFALWSAEGGPSRGASGASASGRPEEAKRRLIRVILDEAPPLRPTQPPRSQRARERIGAWLWRLIRALSLMEAHQW